MDGGLGAAKPDLLVLVQEGRKEQTVDRLAFIDRRFLTCETCDFPTDEGTSLSSHERWDPDLYRVLMSELCVCIRLRGGHVGAQELQKCLRP